MKLMQLEKNLLKDTEMLNIFIPASCLILPQHDLTTLSSKPTTRKPPNPIGQAFQHASVRLHLSPHSLSSREWIQLGFFFFLLYLIFFFYFLIYSHTPHFIPLPVPYLLSPRLLSTYGLSIKCKYHLVGFIIIIIIF